MRKHLVLFVVLLALVLVLLAILLFSGFWVQRQSTAVPPLLAGSLMRKYLYR